MFRQSEWRTANQISGFFSRLATKEEAVGYCHRTNWRGSNRWRRRRMGKRGGRVGTNETVSVSRHKSLHSLQYRGEDLCSLNRRGKLHSKFKIKELEDICQYCDLSVEGLKNRKVSFRFRHFCPSSKLPLFQEIITLCFISLCFLKWWISNWEIPRVMIGQDAACFFEFQCTRLE